MGSVSFLTDRLVIFSMLTCVSSAVGSIIRSLLATATSPRDIRGRIRYRLFTTIADGDYYICCCLCCLQVFVDDLLSTMDYFAYYYNCENAKVA